jgi:hypothetical protein
MKDRRIHDYNGYMESGVVQGRGFPVAFLKWPPVETSQIPRPGSSSDPFPQLSSSRSLSKRERMPQPAEAVDLHILRAICIYLSLSSQHTEYSLLMGIGQQRSQPEDGTAEEHKHAVQVQPASQTRGVTNLHCVLFIRMPWDRHCSA